MGKRLNRRRRKTVPPQNVAARKAGLVITLQRRDALVRQLDSAIRMWFLGYDPVPIHLILMPAYDVLCSLGRKSGNAPKIEEIVGKDSFRGGYDWMRHASSDPHDFIDFPPRTNEHLLWALTISFGGVFGRITIPMMTFQAAYVLWLAPEAPKLRESADAFMPKGITPEEAERLERKDFFVKLGELFAEGIMQGHRAVP